MAAAKNGHDECVSLLISAGADLFAVTKVYRFLKKVINVDNLLEIGNCHALMFCFCVIGCILKDEWNAIIYAKVNKHDVSVKLLKTAGGEVS